MATHSSIVAWKIPQTEEPGGLQSMGLQELDTTEYIHTTVSEGSPLFIVFNTYLLPLDNSHSDRCEMVSHCGFELHFPGD